MSKLGRYLALSINILRIGLGSLFIYAALDKIIAPAHFAQVIYNYRILPIEIVNICAIIIPWLEITLGICLVLGIWLETSSIVVAGLTVVFIGMIVSAIVRGLNIECGCFSLNKSGDIVSWKRIAEDLVILAAALYIFFHEIKTES